MPPLVVDIINRHKSALLNREAAQMASMARHWRNTVEVALQDKVELFTRRVMEEGLSPSAILSRQFQLDRYNELLRQTRREMDKYTDYLAPMIETGQRQAGAAGIAQSTAAIEAVGEMNGITIKFDRLPVSAIEDMVGLAGDDSPLRATLTNTYGAGADGMLNRLIRGVSLGENPRVVARSMVRDGLSQSLSHMMVVARTEQLRVYRESSRETYIRSGVVEAYKRLSAKDRRTCPACLMADGQVYELKEPLEEHPAGRCTLVCIVSGMPPVTWQEGPDWFLEQSPEVQSEILGPGRYVAWQEGRFELDQLVSRRYNDTWGNSLQPTSLKALLNGTAQPVTIRRLDPNRPITPLIQPIEKPKPAAVVSDGFPAELANLEKVKRLGGSTGAELVRDPTTGQLYVMKRGANPGHLLEEINADAAYKALGVKVPDYKLYDDNGQPVKLAKFIEGAQSLADIRTSNPSLYDKAVKALKKDFAADALLGNWDVIGLSSDNILVDKKGVPWRIDNGGSLRYRAQGALKSEFSQYVDEFWTLRNPRINAQTAAVYGDLSYGDLVKQMNRLEKSRDSLLNALPAELRGIMSSRLDTVKDLASIYGIMHKDSFIDTYIDDFSRHSIGLRKSNIIEQHQLSNRGVIATDETGKLWDNYRSTDGDSAIGKLDTYMSQNGGDYRTISYWADRQAADSWTGAAQAVKYFYASQRGDLNDYWWKMGVDYSEVRYAEAKQAVGATYDETLKIWHAFNYEFMRNTSFKNNNLIKGTVTLIRTENETVMALNNLAKGNTGTIKRGAVESTSIFETVTVFGSEKTIQVVPHHRVFGVYFFERDPGSNTPMFLSDGENEIVAMMEGVRVKYVKR